MLAKKGKQVEELLARIVELEKRLATSEVRLVTAETRLALLEARQNRLVIVPAPPPSPYPCYPIWAKQDVTWSADSSNAIHQSKLLL